MKKILMVVLALSLLGAGCRKTGNPLVKINWPEMCLDKELYEDFPAEYLLPDTAVAESTSMGFGGEKASTGEEYAESLDGFGGSFCAKASVEEVLSWYDKTLIEKGFKKLGEIDGEQVYEKDRTSISVAAYDIDEGFSLYSFQIFTRNYNMP